MPTSILQDAKEALEGLDSARLVEAYAETFVFRDVPSEETITDRTDLKTYFDRLFSLPDVAFSDVAVFEASAFGALEWTWSGSKRSSGAAYRIRGASIIELRSGKISRESIYYDPRPALA